MPVLRIDGDEAVARFSATLVASNVRNALAYLLSLTTYRFIAIFTFQDGLAHAVIYYDKENPQDEYTQQTMDSSTYCCSVRDSQGVFMTANAMLDARTKDHPQREIIPAYCGIPILDAEGVILGTLCHYDVVPRDPEQIDLPLMLSVASALARGSQVRPYQIA